MDSELRYKIHEVLVELLNDDKDVVLEYVGRVTRIRYTSDRLKDLTKGGSREWDGTDYILLFEIENRENVLDLLVVIGPGDSQIREQVYGIALENIDLFNSVSRGELSPMYKRIFRRKLIDWNVDNELNINNIRGKLKELYKEFRSGTYEEIVKYLFDELKRSH